MTLKRCPILKYGTVIGFADSNIKKGQVLTNKNVLFKEFNREHNYCSKYKPTNYIENNLQKLLWDINVKMEGLEQEIILQ